MSGRKWPKLFFVFGLYFLAGLSLFFTVNLVMARLSIPEEDIFRLASDFRFPPSRILPLRAPYALAVTAANESVVSGIIRGADGIFTRFSVSGSASDQKVTFNSQPKGFEAIDQVIAEIDRALKSDSADSMRAQFEKRGTSAFRLDMYLNWESLFSALQNLDCRHDSTLFTEPTEFALIRYSCRTDFGWRVLLMNLVAHPEGIRIVNLHHLDWKRK